MDHARYEALVAQNTIVKLENDVKVLKRQLSLAKNAAKTSPSDIAAVRVGCIL